VRRRATVLRGLGAAVSLALFATPLLESRHAATVQHVTCPEDGELIDAGSQGAARAQRAVESPTDGPAVAAEEPAGRTREALDHGHCVIALQSHAKARQAAPARVDLHVVELREVEVSTPAPPELRSVALYRLAPKASPPIA
jgi:hypothetical protein